MYFCSLQFKLRLGADSQPTWRVGINWRSRWIDKHTDRYALIQKPFQIEGTGPKEVVKKTSSNAKRTDINDVAPTDSLKD